MKGKDMFVAKSCSFPEMSELSNRYFLSLSPQERLDIVQYLREQFYKIRGVKPERLNKKICRSGSWKKI